MLWTNIGKKLEQMNLTTRSSSVHILAPGGLGREDFRGLGQTFRLKHQAAAISTKQRYPISYTIVIASNPEATENFISFSAAAMDVIIFNVATLGMELVQRVAQLAVYLAVHIIFMMLEHPLV